MQFARNCGRLAATIVIRILIFFLNAYCLPVLAEPPAPKLQRVRLQLKWKHQFQFAGYYAAIEKGFYREKGLEVELKEIQPGKESSDLVLKGEAEFGIGMSDLIWQHHQGKPIVMLAPIFQHSPLILIARSDAGIESVHDLPGQTIMMEPVPENSTPILKWNLSPWIKSPSSPIPSAQTP